MTKELNFDLTIAEVSVTISGEQYILREASENVARAYQNAISRCTKFDDGKLSTINGPLADTKSLLVSLCLFDITNKTVPLNTIRAWPTRIVDSLFNKAKEISGLDADEETIESLQEKAKGTQEKIEALQQGSLGNDSSSTGDGSD